MKAKVYWTIDDLARQPWPAANNRSGLPAGEFTAHGDVVGILAAVGTALSDLHRFDHRQLAVPRVPAGWQDLFRSVKAILQDDRFDSGALPSPYDRYGPADLLRIVSNGRPPVEDLVVCHGALDLDCVLVEVGSQQQSRGTGFDGVEAIRVADRHFDLASLHLDIHHRIGGDGVFAFYDHYTIEPSLIALDHYVLIHHILNASGPS